MAMVILYFVIGENKVSQIHKITLYGNLNTPNFSPLYRVIFISGYGYGYGYLGAVRCFFPCRAYGPE